MSEKERRKTLINQFNIIIKLLFEKDYGYELKYEEDKENTHSKVSIYRENEFIASQGTGCDSPVGLLKDTVKLLKATII